MVDKDDHARSQALWLPAAAEPYGVLLVHGFSGSPYELHLLAQALHRRGYHVAVPQLAGHHDSLRALTDSRYPDWLASADAALHTLWSRVAASSGQRPRLAVVGLSMGGLLTVELAHRYPATPGAASGTATATPATVTLTRDPAGGAFSPATATPATVTLTCDPAGAASPPAPATPAVEAIGLLAAPLWLSPFAERGIRALTRVPVLRRLFVPKVTGSDLRARDLPPHRLRPRGMPFLALRSLLDLMAEARRHLPQVRQPAFLAHGENDHTAPYACLAAFAAELGTPHDQLTCLSLPRSYHQLVLDVEREVVFAAVVSHLERYLGRPAAS